MTIEIPIEVLQRTWARELQREAIAALICSSADDRRNRVYFICIKTINNRTKRMLRKRLLLRLLKPNK